jgi:hypothetical protein
MTHPSLEVVVQMLTSNQAPRAEFAYIDDSGDPGMAKGSTTFGLGCVMVPLDQWTARLDLVHGMRRTLSETYRVRVRDEVKAEWLSNVKKHFRELGLGDGQLRDIYQQHLRMLSVVSSGAFAVVIQKDRITDRTKNPEEIAWEYLLQRMRMRSNATGAPIVIVHDQTSNYGERRKQIRRFRRLSWAPGSTMVTAPLIVEDPVSRESQHSFFIQMADLVAYAASRKVIPARGRGNAICSERMWLELGSASMPQVSGRGDGIVVWP